MNKNTVKKNKKNSKNYRIFRVEPADAKPCDLDFKKITMEHFFADNDKDAYNKLIEYKKIANKEYKYYVEYWTGEFNFKNLNSEKMSFFRKLWDNIVFNINYYVIEKIKDVYRFFRNIFYLLKYKQEYSASWTIDDKILNVLLHNIPILKKNKMALSWAMLEKAILEKNKDKKNFNIKEYYASCYCGFPKDIEKRAVELEHEMFDQLIEDIKLYKYYTWGYDYIDKNDKEAVEFDNKWRHTLPLIKGSFDRYDYEKLNKMSEKYWNKIFETVRKYGREFND